MVRVVVFIIGAMLAGSGGYLVWINRALASSLFPIDPAHAPWTLVGGMAAAAIGLVMLVAGLAPRTRSRAQKVEDQQRREKTIKDADAFYASRAQDKQHPADRDWRSGALPPESKPQRAPQPFAAPPPQSQSQPPLFTAQPAPQPFAAQPSIIPPRPQEQVIPPRPAPTPPPAPVQAAPAPQPFQAAPPRAPEPPPAPRPAPPQAPSTVIPQIFGETPSASTQAAPVQAAPTQPQPQPQPVRAAPPPQAAAPVPPPAPPQAPPLVIPQIFGEAPTQPNATQAAPPQPVRQQPVPPPQPQPVRPAPAPPPQAAAPVPPPTPELVAPSHVRPAVKPQASSAPPTSMPGASPFFSGANLSPIPRASDPPPQPVQAKPQPAPAAPAPTPIAAAVPSSGNAAFDKIRVLLGQNRLDEADKVLSEERERLTKLGDTEKVALAELTALAGDHAAAAGRTSNAKWLWRLALKRFQEAQAMSVPAAKAVSERLRLADQ